MQDKTRCEVIMAARGELRGNITRTIENVNKTKGEHDKLTVILDGEEENLKLLDLKKAKIVVPWKNEHRGCGACRHYGIEKSKAEYVALIDAHMDFPLGWIDRAVEHLKEEKKDIICFHMKSLYHDWKEMNPFKDFSGCRIWFKTVEDGDAGRRYWALSGKWFDTPQSEGEIPCIMGACYVMRKDWYEKIGKPLSILRGWGQDEELLSLASWLCGGRCWLMPLPACMHIYAAPHTRAVQYGADDERLALANRYAAVQVLPISDEIKQDLYAWLDKNILRRSEIDKILAPRMSKIEALRKHLEKPKRAWKELEELKFFRQGAETGKVKVNLALTQKFTKSQPPQPPQVVIRHIEVCKRCGAHNSFRQFEGMKNFGAFYQAYSRCMKCGRRALIRKVQG